MRSKQRFQGRIEPQVRFDRGYIVRMAAAGALAAVAFLVNSVPILIGSMVIAPAFPPLVLMSMGLASGNRAAFLRGGGIALGGLTVALISTMGTTRLLSVTGVNPADLHLSPMLTERVSPGWYSVVAAIAAGAAGALAVEQNKSDTLVGVVSSIALVPSMAGAGIAGMVGNWDDVIGGFVMLFINVGTIVIVGWLTLHIFSVGHTEAR